MFRQNRSLAAPADIPAEARKIHEEALLKVTKAEIFQKSYKDDMISEGYMAGDEFMKYLNDMSAKDAAILGEMGMIKKR